MRLKPACSSPISLPSLTGTSWSVAALGDLRDRSPHALDRVGDGARSEQHRCQADGQTDRAEEDHRRGEPVTGLVADPHHLGAAREHEAEHRGPGAQRPGQQHARGDAGDGRLLRHALRERQLRHRAQDALGEQVAERARDGAAEQHRDPDGDRQPRRVLQVQRQEPGGGDAPERSLDDEQPQRRAQRARLLDAVRRATRAQPAHHRPQPVVAPEEAHRDRGDEARGERDPVRAPRLQVVRDVRQRQHPREEGEHDHRARDVRGHDRRAQRQGDPAQDRFARRRRHGGGRYSTPFRFVAALAALSARAAPWRHRARRAARRRRGPRAGRAGRERGPAARDPPRGPTRPRRATR